LHDVEHYRALERLYLEGPFNQSFNPTIQVGEGTAEITISVTPDHHTAGGSAHGALYFKALNDAAFFAARAFTRRAGNRLSVWLTAGTLLAVVGYTLFLWDNILMARLLPFSNVIILANWYPLFLGILAGVVWNNVDGSRSKQALYTTGMIGLAVYAVARPIWGEFPDCDDRWQNGVCLQTTPKTCSPCCAATILLEVGIVTDETEMAELCLTRKGTLWQGLYRGLKRKTQGTGWDVEVFTGEMEGLRQLTKQGPVILTVGVPEGPVDEIYTKRYGWSRGELHSVVLFGFDDKTGTEAEQRVNMGDPSVEDGREQWSVEDLRVLYRGRGLRLAGR